MTDNTPGDGPVVRDRRRIDPETGQVRDTADGTPEAEVPTTDDPATDDLGSPAEASEVGTDDAPEHTGVDDDLSKARQEAAEHLADLQRLQAEYVNYRRRVDRDRDVVRDQAVASVLEALLPVLDDVHLARQHGDLADGPFASIAEKLEAVLGRYGLERFGEPGAAFDPMVHEALIRSDGPVPEGATTTTVVQVLQPGYKAGERVLRPARVAVADPA